MHDTYIEEVFKKIVEQNSNGGPNGIPHSDIFEKQIQALLGIDGTEINRIIRILKDSHKIFTFEIIKEDMDNEVKRVEGYVETDLQTLRKLKNYFQKLLMDEYEKQFNKRMLVHQIVKDIYSRGNFYKNTMIGQLGNKAIMLEEYEGFIEQNFNEFTDSWKAKRMAEVILISDNKPLRENASPGANNPGTGAQSDASQRAVDSPKYQNYSFDKSKQSLDKVLQIYGVEFFFRINLRKYNFDLLRQVVESGEIDRRADLVILKEMIQKMKSNIGKDPTLFEYTDRIYKLERIISRQMLYSH